MRPRNRAMPDSPVGIARPIVTLQMVWTVVFVLLIIQQSFRLTVQNTYRHPQRAKAFAFHVEISLWHPQSGFPRRVHY